MELEGPKNSQNELGRLWIVLTPKEQHFDVDEHPKINTFINTDI
jgi:hypothetical protein